MFHQWSRERSPLSRTARDVKTESGNEREVTIVTIFSPATSTCLLPACYLVHTHMYQLPQTTSHRCLPARTPSRSHTVLIYHLSQVLSPRFSRLHAFIIGRHHLHAFQNSPAFQNGNSVPRQHLTAMALGASSPPSVSGDLNALSAL